MRKTRRAGGVSPLDEHSATGAMTVQGANAPRSPRASARPGLTLLELMLVVFILSMVAFSAVSLTNTLDEQSRWEASRDRLDLIRRAIAGRSGQALSGQSVVDGFVADMGRPPATLTELLVPAGVPWSYSADYQQWAGWRGPYLQSTGLRGVDPVFRDGWGNGDRFPLDPNFGWRPFDLSTSSTAPLLDGAGNLVLQSFGADGITDPASVGYAVDYPPDGILLRPDDWSVRGWSITVRFENPVTGGMSPPPLGNEDVRVRVHYPVNGSFAWIAPAVTPWPGNATDRDNAPYLSNMKKIPSVPDGEYRDIEFTFVDATNQPKSTPWGIRTIMVVKEDGSPLVASSTPFRLTLLPRSQPAINPISWKLE